MDNTDTTLRPVGPVRASRPAGAAGRRRRFLPPQHGAWAMLAVPYLAGLFTAGYRWPDLPLLGAWIAGYLLSYYLFQTVKSRRPSRYRDQLVLYSAMATPLAALVITVRPHVACHQHGTTLRPFLPAAWDHPGCQ